MSYTSTLTQLPPDVLRTFIYAVETGSFTNAAELVHRTQSAVSMQMKRLESDLEKPLFVRQGRGVRLTTDGETLYRYALRLTTLHDEALAALTQPQLSGVVRLGAPEDYAAQYVPSALQRFATLHPRITVDVYCDVSENLSRQFQDGELDVMITTESRADGPFCRQQDLMWIVEEHGTAMEQSPLPLALFHEGCHYRRNTLTALEEAGISYRIAYGSPSLAGILAIVRAGLAVAVVAHGTAIPGCRRLTKNEGLPFIPPVGIALRLNQRNNTPATRSLHRFIDAELEMTTV
ncbi:LysR substrate-binding domain-containing protein [Pseudodesulfovibrio piezophilus]|uniref:Transcriptional regulator, LysR family n=1 Tax=Pseudodesulfovibrio piezophilus (strain DSM 21447 / JCM 15486 / C1TLV30) TaxID=1322246 RepID=M1WJL6_PSEP2|nr:LysR substrate-binding domain-containing protein [Pseudodesulfovibrio piezophilus]CCH48111.1 Transcriptional regulator, LysR family [Pseudodesulfovibrio piezophilus C1TLV30]